MSARLVRAAFESLELRRMLSTVTLVNGDGDGSLNVDVDPYGAFGISAVGKALQYGDRRLGNLGEVDKSFVYFTPIRQFLTQGYDPVIDDSDATAPLTLLPGYTSTLPSVEFTSTTSRSAVSSFVLEGVDIVGQPFKYQIELTQTLAETAETDRSRYTTTNIGGLQSQLVQTYRITNLLTTTTSFSMVRYLETRSNEDVGYVDAEGDGELDVPQTSSTGPNFVGFSYLLDDGRTVGINGTASANYLQIRSSGGTLGSASIQAAGLDNRIKGSNGISSAFQGVANAFPDDLGNPTNITFGYSGLAHQFDFVLGAGETTEFSTSTIIAQGTAVQFQNLLNEALGNDANVVPTAGDFAFEGSVYNITAPATGSSTLSLVITRLNGSDGAATAILRPTFVGGTGSTDPAGVSITSETSFTFADGQTSLVVPITITSAVGTEPSSFYFTITSDTASPDSSLPGGAVGSTAPSVAIVNVKPALSAFTIDQPATVSAGTSKAKVTIRRTGNTDSTVTINVATNNLGTAIVGTTGVFDYTAYNQNITFAPGQTEAIAEITLGPGNQDLATRTIGLTLSGTNVTIPVANFTVPFVAVDAGAPRITSLTTNVSRNRISSITLTFSEALRGPGDLSAYGIFLRSGEGSAGSAKLKAVPLSSVSYNSANSVYTVTVTPRSPLAFNKLYQVSVRSDASLTDLSFNRLNQAEGTGGAVSAYNRVFSRSTRVAYSDADGDVVTLSMKSGSFELIRQTSGEAATVTLFGAGAGTSVFSGTIRSKVKGKTASASIGQLVGSSTSTVSLPANISVGATA